ncbi:MAG TPA: 30S ribosomal protein S7 [Candidatus Nanoarchaeia archaeon]|nr:30S ribosomal protein S7 [Candidatus Nanoarchaeia archaeon]
MMEGIKFFNKWDQEKIVIEDLGLVRYINLEPKIMPKTGARYAGNRFHKSNTFIVERLATKLMGSGHKGKKHFMSSGHNTGKKNKVLKIVENALSKAESKLKQNPLAILVKAIENAAPREEVISIEYGGARYPKAVDVSPQRRIDLALRYITQGAYTKSFNKKVKIEDALAEELISAYKLSTKSNAISKKRDFERQAASSK